MARSKATQRQKVEKAAKAAKAAVEGNATKERKPIRHSQNFNFKSQYRRLTTGKDALKDLLPRATLKRVIKDVLQNLGKGDYRLKSKAVDAIQAAVGMEAHTLFMHANTFARHSGRVEVLRKDLRLAAKMKTAAHELNSSIRELPPSLPRHVLCIARSNMVSGEWGNSAARNQPGGATRRRR